MEFIKNRKKTAIIYDEKNFSYGNLISNAKYYATNLNIKKEDRVAIYMENRPELIFSFLSIWDKKGTCVCLDSSSKITELEYFLSDCKPKYVFTSEQNIENLKNAIKNIGLEKEITPLNVDKLGILNSELDEVIYAPERDSVALMLYTSGTTGNPKGVMLTFDNILVNIEGLDKYNMYIEDDRILALLPMHHIFPLLGTGIIPMRQGATIVFLKELSSQALLEALKRYKITMFIAVPRVWEMLHKKIMEKIEASKITKLIYKICKKMNNENLNRKIFKQIQENFGGHMRFLVSGGSKLNPEISSDFKTFGFSMCEGYGLTETAPMISFTPIGANRPGSAGKILPEIEVKIAEDGEILAKGRNVMKGYYNKPEATKEVIDKDGWFHTGDLGELKDGFLYVTGRKKEMIVLSNGKNINPIEIEQWIMKNTDLIEEIAVIENNKVLTAVIYPNFEIIKKEKITNILESLKTGIIDKYNSKAPNYKKILDIKIVQNELPKTKIGKIRRFLIPDLISGKIDETLEEKPPQFEEYQEISKYLKDIKGKNIKSTDHLELDLGLDSLDIVEFMTFIENSFGVKITEEILLNNSTVLQISEYVKKNTTGMNIQDIDWKKILEKESTQGFPKTNFIGKIIKFLLFLPFKFYVSIEKIGEIEKLDRPCIFIGNHQSFLDGFILSQSLKNNILNNSYFLAKIAHFKKSMMKYFAENSNIILIDINKDLSETLQAMATALRKGKNMIIFPEGTRTRDGELQKFRKFYAILAKELEVDIQPFAIKGAYELFPANKKIPKMGKVQIKFFERMSVKNMSVDEIVEKNISEIKDWLKR